MDDPYILDDVGTWNLYGEDFSHRQDMVVKLLGSLHISLLYLTLFPHVLLLSVIEIDKKYYLLYIFLNISKGMEYINKVIQENKRLNGDGEYTKRCSEWLEKNFHAKKVLLTTTLYFFIKSIIVS